MILRIIKRCLYIAGWSFFYAAFTVIWRRKVYGLQHIPKNRPVILASNHMSNADPPVVGSSLRREVYFIAKEELFKVPFIGIILKLVNGFPVKRGKQDVGAFKYARDLVQKNNILLMFPEGHRNPKNKPLRPKPGVGLLAHMSNAAVVPVRILNTDKLMQFKKIYVIFGKPIYFQGSVKGAGDQKTDTYRLFAEQVMEEIKKLKI